MHFARTVRPTKTSVSVGLLRSNERIGHAAETANIELFLRAAEGLIEKRTGRSIMKQTFRLSTTRVQPSVRLWYPPMEGDITLASVKSDIAGAAVTYDIATLRKTISDMQPLIGFPTITRAAAGVMTIEYTAGAENEDDVPAEIRQAVLLLAGHYYRNREAAQTDSRVASGERALPFGVDALIAAYRIPNIQTPFYEDI